MGAAETLNWDAFSEQHFPERRRHDSDARSAYFAYKQGRERRTIPARPHLVLTTDASTTELVPHDAPTRSAELSIHQRNWRKEACMARERSELEQRRDELRGSLPALSDERAATYRRNNDALALDRTGVKHEHPEEMARLKKAQETADEATRNVHRELRDINTQIERERRRGIRARFLRLSRQRPTAPWVRASRLISGVVALSTSYPEGAHVDDPDPDEAGRAPDREGADDHGTSYGHSRGLPYVYPENDLGFVSNLLSMMLRIAAPKYLAEPALERALEVLLIRRADHEQNCSPNAHQNGNFVAIDDRATARASA
jgi:hypothetical protein